MKRVPFFAPLVMLMMVATAGFSAVDNVQPMTAQILTATPARTVVAAEFDAAVTVQRLSTLQPGERITDGLGSLLAIAGHGNPSAFVQNLELGEPLAGTFSLDDRDIANSLDELVVLGEPAIFHDLRVVSVGYRPLFRDSEGNVRLVTRMDVEVTTFGSGGINEKNDPWSFSSAFAPIYRSVIDNLDELYPELTLRPPGKYLVIVPTTPWPQMQGTQQWQDWQNLKLRKGYQVIVATLQDIQNQIGSSNPDGIRQYIQHIYNQGDLEFVMLLGDVTGNFVIPSINAANPDPAHAGEISIGDNGMQLVDGTDYLPDVLLGRVSFNQLNQFGNYLNKVYRYETDPYLTSTHWLETAICVAGNYADGSYPVTPVWNVNWARDRLLTTGCVTDADTFYYHGPDDPEPGFLTQAITDSIGNGACVVMYRGWAAAPGWQYPRWEIQDIDEGALQMGRRNAAFFGIVCGSANYNYSNGPCLGEYLTTAMGTVASPNGGIVYYGASDISTNTRHNNAILAGMTDAILLNGLRSSTSIAAVGELLAYRQFPLEQQPIDNDTTSLVEYYIFHVFNLLGDPETQLHICYPTPFDLTHPASLDHGTSLVDVLVQADGAPVHNAVVTMRAGTTGAVQAVTSDASGHAYVPCDVREASVAQLTVWKGQHFLRFVDIPVGPADFDPAITDVSWLDGNDNAPNPGETVPFTLTVQYLGVAASDLNCTLTSLDPRVTIINGAGSFGTLQPGQTGTSSQMSITLSGELADGQTPRIQVQFTGNSTVNRLMEVPVAAPDPLMLSFLINDGNNGILEPGETVSVSVTLINNGHQIAGNLTATVYSWDNAVTFPDNQIAWGTVNIGQTVASSDPFQIMLANGVTPGRQIQLRYDLMNNGVPAGTRGQVLTAGVVTLNAPTGPDAYGYYAYEDIDAGYTSTPTYSWIELDPQFGGSGATPDSVRDDTYFLKPLPAPFTFYGQAYNNIWICSNGWFSFENPHLPEFRNWELPMTMAPWLLVAPYWEDLIIEEDLPNQDSLWYVWTRWDAPNRFIIMWRAFNRACLTNEGNECPEIFEAILEYNPAGDGNILFQYNSVFARDNGDNPSGFATAGIQNYYLQTGLNLTYANLYPASMDTLRANRAIRITTTPPDNFLGAEEPGADIPTEFALHDAYPNPFNPMTEIRFDLPETGSVTLKVYDVLGREQVVLVDEIRTAGRYQMTFDARALPSGLYFARLESNHHSQVKKLMLVK